MYNKTGIVSLLFIFLRLQTLYCVTSAIKTPNSVKSTSTSVVDTPTSAMITPTSTEDTPTSADTTSTSAKNTPTYTENKSSSAENTPTTAENKPTSAENKLSSAENTPTTAENTPTTAENTPTTAENTPTTAENTPTTAENTPSSVENTPTTAENTPTTLSWRPWGFSSTLTNDWEVPNDCPHKLCHSESITKITGSDDAVQCCQLCNCHRWCYSPGSGICCPTRFELLEGYDDEFVRGRLINTNFSAANDRPSASKSRAIRVLFDNSTQFENYVNQSIPLPLPLDLYPCVMIDDLLNRARGLNYQITQREAFRVIQSCPSVELAQKFPACEAPETLEDYRLVSDDKGLIYKNVHCARCHSVKKMSRWTLEPFCDWLTSEEFPTFEQMNGFIRKYCKLESYLESGNISVLARCFSRYTPPTAYCATDHWDKHYEYKSELSGQKFSALLNIREHEDIGDKERICKSNEVWDFYQLECRRLFCPVLMLPLNGKCVDMFKSHRGFMLELLFKVANWNDSVELKFDLFFFNSNDIYLVNCKICAATLEQTSQDEKVVYVRATIKTDGYCTFDRLINYFGPWSNRTYSGWMNGILFELEFQPVDIETPHTLMNFNHDQCLGGTFASRGILTRCDQIEVPKHLAKEPGLDIHALVFDYQPVSFGRAKKVLCYDDYAEFMKARTETNGNGFARYPNMIQIVTLLLAACYVM